MSDRRDPLGLRSDLSLLSQLGEDVAAGIFQDLQGYIQAQFRWPTSIIIREEDDSVERCFPRERYRGFCRFCRELREKGRPDPLSVCVEQGNDYVRKGILAEEAGSEWKWGWHRCHMGLWDCFIPIRAVTHVGGPSTVLAVLSAGQYRLPGDEASRYIHDRINAATTGDDWLTYFPDVSEKTRLQLAERLHGLVNDVPTMSFAQQSWMEARLSEAVGLVEYIETRSLFRSMIVRSEEFVQSLGLDKVDLRIGERSLWQEVEAALRKVVDHFGLDSAVVYSSNHGDYAEMDRTLLVPSRRNVAEAVGFPSYGVVKWLAEQNGVSLPTDTADCWWLSPQTYFGAESATVFVVETATNHIIVIGFGHNQGMRESSIRRAVLSQVITLKVFPFIEHALFRIELDHLLTETGHLMGRARGKVFLGYEALKRILPESLATGCDADLYRQATWAMEDGLTRLELIGQNFYSFSGRRLRKDGDIASDDAEASSLLDDELLTIDNEVDVVGVLQHLRPFFERSVSDHPGAIRFLIDCEDAVVRGRENSLALVFLNLFDNAAKFSYAGTYVEVSAACDEKSCVVKFGNLGIGVPEDETRRVFEPFTQARFKNPFKRIEGLGLGLAFCRRVVEDELGGVIELSSREAFTPNPRRFEGDNWLTTVTVRLPLRAKEQETTNAQQHPLF